MISRRQALIAGGAGVAVVGLLPVLESLFKRTTDITLLELTDYNHPLLRRMQLDAPGTYHHSLIVAQLSENACNAIGANPLVARVCALFHDIGKPRTRRFDDGRVSFHHHEVVGARMTRKRMKELRFSNELIDDVSVQAIRKGSPFQLPPGAGAALHADRLAGWRSLPLLLLFTTGAAGGGGGMR